MKKFSVSQIITVLATLLTITVNGLANGLPLNGQGTGEISDRFDIYFVPAGYVFSIWGVIYLGLIAFTVYQALPAQRDSSLLRKIYPAYWIGNLANTAWIFLWHYEFFPLTLVAMLTILATLLYLYQQLPSGEIDSAQKWAVKYPFSIYLGWISVATIANISQVLFFIDWGGWGISPAVWAVIMIVVASALGVLLRVQKNDLLYTLVLVWALVGIAVSQADTALIANTAWAASVLLGVVVIGVPLLKK